MIRWGAEQDERARALIGAVVAGGPNRLASWRDFMVLVAPHIEAWARGNRILRRCRLTGDDDARAVMVALLERLAAGDHAKLRAFLEREATQVAERDELMDALAGLARLDDDDEAEADDARQPIGWPAKTWLMHLVDEAVRAHVRRRFGWIDPDDGPSTGDLDSTAVHLDTVPAVGARPPKTDRMTVSKLVLEVQAYLASLPEQTQSALALWLDDLGFDEIARRLALAGADEARQLVRAGQARMREHFRGRAPLFE